MYKPEFEMLMIPKKTICINHKPKVHYGETGFGGGSRKMSAAGKMTHLHFLHHV